MLSYMVLFGYTAIAFMFTVPERIIAEHLFFVFQVYLLTDLSTKYAPKCFTFSESFTLSTVFAVYVNFALKELLRPIASSAGSHTVNIALYLPWLALFAGLIALFILRWALKPSLSMTIASLLILSSTLVYAFSHKTLMPRVMQILLDPTNVQMMGYLAITLAIGLFILYDLLKRPED